MNNKKAIILVIITSILFVLAGFILYFIFDRQGMSNNNNKYINYNVNDYVFVEAVSLDDYSDVYSSVNVSQINFKNLDNSLVEKFLNKQEEIIDYVTGYYNEIKNNTNYGSANSAVSTIKTQINGGILSVFYKLDFYLDENIFINNKKSYVVTLNIDLKTNSVLTNDQLLDKYSYTKSYIVNKLFNEDILINKNEIVVDKNTNISLTRIDIERKKDEYVERIILDFNNIIDMYIENNSLVLVYNNQELKNIFFDDEFETNVKFKYLK